MLKKRDICQQYVDCSFVAWLTIWTMDIAVQNTPKCSMSHIIYTHCCCAYLCCAYHITVRGWLVRYRLTHWGRVTHICVSNQTIIGPYNGLSPGRRQAIIWTNAGILLIGPWGTNFSEILISIQAFSFRKMHLKMSSAKWRPFCIGLNVLLMQDVGRIDQYQNAVKYNKAWSIHNGSRTVLYKQSGARWPPSKKYESWSQYAA